MHDVEEPKSSLTRKSSSFLPFLLPRTALSRHRRPASLNYHGILFTPRLLAGRRRLRHSSSSIQLLHEVRLNPFAPLVPPLPLYLSLRLDLVYSSADYAMVHHLVGALEDSLAPVGGERVGLQHT